ncbi:MAG: peptidase M50 [Planctomycetes bacterium GWF2_41_51]|nr:MAG: peptidase M50 [Planctomycetes bacterium GWF2_41_51]HBG25560.1 site-2 protease family protein [Phycisphaerales bacterium]
MFENRISLFSLFGFKVKLDITWFILAVLITWSLAKGVFPMYFEGLTPATYWWMGAVGAVGLFVSIIFHEFFHSFIAKLYGLPMKGITLFIFGGVSEMEEEPESPKIEFLMAIAGPISSLVLGGIFYLLVLISRGINMPQSVSGVLIYLSIINVVLAVFNMIPAFPLDGGRVLRSILWGAKHNLRWATHIASSLGSAFGILLIILGIMSLISGNFIGGLWYFLIGMFIRGASKMSYRQLIIRKALAGEEVDRFMKTDPVAVTPDLTIPELVRDFFYKFHYKMFPVLEGETVKGCITSRDIKQIPHNQWDNYKVADLTKSCNKENSIQAHSDAVKALSQMSSTGNSRLLVLEGNRLAGIVTLKDLLKFLALKIDLEGDDEIDLPQI